jgi:hypothetical protein
VQLQKQGWVPKVTQGSHCQERSSDILWEISQRLSLEGGENSVSPCSWLKRESVSGNLKWVHCIQL